MPQWDQRPTYRRRRAAALAVLCALLALVTWAVAALVRAVLPDRPAQPVAAAPASGGEPAHVRTGRAPAITLAFAGDTQAHGPAARITTVGLGSVKPVLERADLAMLNLETAVAADTSGLRPQPKQFTFITSPKILDAVHDAGVDVVTAANNHAMDYGEAGLRRMLEVKKTSPVPMVGIGADDTEAWAPWTTEVKGRKVVVLGATDVLDDHLDWKAGPGKPGLAKVRDEDGFGRLLDGVRQARRASPDDVVVVYLHSGIERVKCPTARQQDTMRRLVDAGADVVVGSHAHQLQPQTTRGNAVIVYGMGNFAFGSGSGVTRATGVLTVTVPGTNDAPTTTFDPATVTNGLPVLADGAERSRALATWQALGDGCA